MRPPWLWALVGTIFLAVPPRGITAQPPSRAQSIAGRVVSIPDGRPLARALVELQKADLQEQGSPKAVASTTSAADGSFRLPAVPPGKYNLYGAAAGHRRTCYLQHAELCTGIVLGAGLDTSSLTLSLPAGAVISGHVVENGGAAIEHATVTLYREDLGAAPGRVMGNRRIQTDDLGAYEFADLPPGTYYVSAAATPWYAVHPPADARGAPFLPAIDPALDVVYPLTFFSGALSSDTATPIPVAGGQQVNASILLTPQPSVSFAFRLPAGSDETRHSYSLTRSVFGAQEFVSATTTIDGDTVRITGLAPGAYSLHQGERGSPSGRRAVDIAVVANAAAGELPAFAPAAPVTLHLRFADGRALPAGLRVALRGSTRDGLRPGLVDKDGRVTFTAVPAGDYRPIVWLTRENGFPRVGRGTGVASLTVNGRAAPDRTLHHAGRQPLTGEVTLAAASVAVQGLVKQAGKPAPGVLVLLVPAGADTDPDLYHRDQTDLDGSFALANVLPGNYILVAIADGWSLHWRDSAVFPFLPHGIPLTVTPQNAPVLHLSTPLIPVPANPAAPR